MATSDDSAVKIAHDAMLLDTAVGDDLDRIGAMFLVKRPRALGPNDDTRYRRLIQLLAFQPKQVLRIVYQLLEVLFGKQSDIAAIGLRPWRVYEVNVNEIIVEIPLDLTPGTDDNATYLHGLGGAANGYTGVPVDVLNVPGEDFRRAASTFVGLDLTLVSPVAATFPIVGVTYDPTTGINQIAFTGALPANTYNFTWRITIPDTHSWSGDYLLKDPSKPESEVLRNIVVFFGAGLIPVFEEFMTLIVKASGIVVRIERI